MINSPTTLILGAGASHAYGLPLGEELCGLLVSETASERPLHALLVDAGFKASEIDAFRSSFLGSHRDSIDDFLARRTEFAAVGKAALAAIIRANEDERALVTPKDSDDNWYKYLWNGLAPSWDELDQNQLSIVTFNYDRSFEEFLVRAMAATFKKPMDECWSKLYRFVKIVHVYGQVQGTYGKPSDGPHYGGIQPDALAKIASNIRVIPEGRNDDSALVKARIMLSEAERIAFLGFGFDHTNMERLEAKRVIGRAMQVDQTPTKRRPKVVATVYKRFAGEAQRAFRLCGLRSNQGMGQDDYPPGFIDGRCREVLRRTQILGY